MKNDSEKKVKTLINPIAWLYDKTKHNAFGRSMDLIAGILESNVVQSFVNIAFTVYTSYHFASNKQFTCIYIIILIFYVILLASFFYLNWRKTCRRNSAENLARVSRELQRLIFERMRILDRECKRYIKNDNIELDTDIDSVADCICEAVYRVLSVNLKYDEIEVVLWQAEYNNEELIIHPVTFGTKNDDPPAWLNSSFSSSDEKRYKIVDCFSTNEQQVFLTRKDCLEGLTFNPEDDKNVTRVCQYVALPIRKRDGITSSVLQIRTFKENVFPKEQKEFDEVVRNYISPYCTFYELSMEEQNVIEELQLSDDES